MSDGVVSFDAFETDSQIAAHQSGLVRIVLEGEDDVSLFRRFWFSHRLDVFDFVEAGRVATAPGCTGVSDGVTQSTQEGIPAVGIVDRDTLFREKEWAKLFELDQLVLNAGASAPDIYVTARWEVEAYLLEPERLADWVSAAHRNPPAPERECQHALAKTLDACEVLLSAMPYFAAQHQSGTRVSPGMFCDQAAAQVQTICNTQLAAMGADAQQAAQCVAALVGAVLGHQPAVDVERLPFLLRYVDTKRLLKRLIHTLGIKENMHWVLAVLMMNNGHRPLELDAFLTQVESRFAA